MSTEHVNTWEGVVTVPLAVNNQRAVRTNEGEYVYNLLQFDEGDRVRCQPIYGSTLQALLASGWAVRNGDALDCHPVGQEAGSRDG